MAIKIKYEPVGDIARYAVMAGQGQFADKQADRAMQMAELQQRDIAQQRSIAAQQAAQNRAAQLEMLQRAQGMAFDWARGMRDLQFRAEAAQFEAGQRKAADEANFSQQLQYAKLSDSLIGNRQEEAAKRAWEMDSIGFRENQINEIRKAYTSDRIHPDDQLKFSKHMGALDGIYKWRGKAPPADYSAKIDQWIEDFKGLGIRTQDPPTVDEDFEKSTKKLTHPDTGEFLGWAYREPDGKGGVKWRNEFVKPGGAAGEGPGSKPKKPSPLDFEFHEAVGDDAFYQKLQKSAIDELNDRWKRSHDTGEPPRHKKEDVLKEMRRQFQEEKELRSQATATPDESAFFEEPPEEEQQQPTDVDLLAEAVRRHPGLAPLLGQNPSPAQSSPQQPAQQTIEYPTGEVTLTPDGFHVQGDAPRIPVDQTTGMPAPRSRAERDSLPDNTWYIAPDGSRKLHTTAKQQVAAGVQSEQQRQQTISLEALANDLKRRGVPPAIAAKVTPQLVQTAANAGSRDPVGDVVKALTPKKEPRKSSGPWIPVGAGGF